jgi:methyl-accepting chemotaxis protein
MFKQLFGGRASTGIPMDMVLSRLSTNLMLADKDLNITYVNPAVQTMLIGIESDLRKDLPMFDARNLVGQNIDIFHKNPAYQRHMLTELRGQHRAQITVGGRNLSFVACSMDSPTGERLGYAVEWLDVTSEVKMAKLQQDIADTLAAAASDDLTARVNLDGVREEDLEVCHSVNMLIETLDRLDTELREMSAAHQAGEIDAVIDERKFTGNFRAVAKSINEMVGGHLAVKKQAMAVFKSFGEGDFDAPMEQLPGKKAFINDTIEQVRTNLKGLIAQMNHMSTEHDRGEIDATVNVSDFRGGFAAMAQGVNDMVGSHIAVKKMAMAVVKSFGEGDFDAPMEQLPGKKAFINDTIEQVRANLRALVADATMLSQAAVAGRLETRADASRHAGGFRAIVEGVNETLDSVIGPLNVAADYVDNIARGSIPPKITETYQGDFNTLKNNLNTCIDAVDALVADAGLLAKAAVEGRLETRADANKHQGDFRTIVEGVNQTLDSVIGPLTEVNRVLTALEQGDLTKTISQEYAGTLEQLRQATNNTVDQLARTVGDVITASSQLSDASHQIGSTSQALSSSASQQAASVEETSSSIEEMGASINQNSDNAKVTDGIASSASAAAVEGGEAVQRTVEAMKQIAGKISVIDDIAFQTNMLALNATIEAARAGEHGKGFAVVASEVGKLAERSQLAAQEIAELAAGSVSTAERAGALLDDIVPGIRKTSDLVQEIAHASAEQSGGVSQVTVAMRQMSQLTQQNASASEELAATAEQMTAQTGSLEELMRFFTVDSARSGVQKAGRAVVPVQSRKAEPAAATFADSDFERF